MNAWRVPAIAALVHMCVGLASAAGQTVVVTGLPPASQVELVINGTVAGTATADPQGLASAMASQPETPRPPFEAVIWMDECGDVRRVQIVDRNAVPPEVGGCARTAIEGIFRIQPITSLFIQLGGSAPVLRLRQGPLPEDWLAGASADVPTASSRVVPGGLNLFAGGGISTFRDFTSLACGQVSDCSGKDAPALLTGGVTLWFNRYIGVELGYLRTRRLTAEGSAETFRFSTELEPVIGTLSGKAGLPLGGWRFFGAGGLNYVDAAQVTTQTIDDRTVSTNGTQQTLPGGTQQFGSSLRGWGWQFGGGAEYWFTRYFGVYGEGGRLRIKGDDPDGSERAIDETINYVVVGIRFGVPGF